MSRKQVCRKCGSWYYNHYGLYIALTATYDDSMCGKCNRKIDQEIADNNDTDNMDYRKMF